MMDGRGIKPEGKSVGVMKWSGGRASRLVLRRSGTVITVTPQKLPLFNQQLINLFHQRFLFFLRSAHATVHGCSLMQ